MLVDRETGGGTAVTFWESVDAMNAAEQLAQQLRQQLQASGPEIIDIDRVEILIFDTPAEPVVPTYSRLVQIYVQPEKLDAFINHTKTKARSRIRGYQGFNYLVLGVNRATGRCTVSVGFDSAEARDASEEAGAANRAEATEIAGAPEPTVSRREMVVATPARAVTPA